MRWLITSCLCSVTMACGRPHPLAEWSPEAYAPASPEASWSASWFPPTASPPPKINVAPIAISDPVLLGDAIDLALRRTPETRLAWADAHAAAARYGISRGQWYPTITAFADAMISQSLETPGGPENIQRVREENAGPGVQLTWTLLDFGRRDAADDATARALLASNLDFNRAIQNVIFEVQKHWFALEAQLATLESAEQSMTLATSIRTQIEQRFALGLATAPDVLAARQTEALAGYEIQVAETGIHDARTDLLIAMGLPPDTLIDFQHDVDRPLPDALALGVEQLAELAIAARPDLSAASARVQEAEARIRAAKATLNPSVDLLAGVAYRYTDYHLSPYTGLGPDHGHGWAPTWSVGAVGSWTLFDGGIRHNEIRMATAQRDAAHADLRAAQLAIEGEVWRAYFNYENAVDRHVWAQRLSESAEESLAATEAAFALGLRTLPEIQTAEQQVAAARSIRIASRADVLIAAAAMVHATGDLRVDQPAL